MAINEWRGDAPAVAQVVRLDPPVISGQVEFYIGGRPLGWNAPWDASLIPALVQRWNSSTMGEFREVIASQVTGVSSLYLTAREAGRPFTVTTTVGGRTRSNEIQSFSLFNATGGTFTLTFNGQTTSSIAAGATAATVQTALEALSNLAPGDLTVAKVGDTWTVTFTGAYLETNVPVIGVNYSGLTGGTCEVVVTPVQTGVLPINAVQVVSLPGTPTGGTAVLSLDGVSTTALAFSANAATCQAAAEAAWGAGCVSCSGSTLTAGITFTFQGSLGGTPLSLIVGDGSSLTGGATLLSMSTVTAGVAGTSTSKKWALSGDPATADSNGRTGWQFILVVDGWIGHDWTTSLLSYDDDLATIQTAVENMFRDGMDAGDPAFPGAGNVTVSGSLDNSWVSGGLTVTFGGHLHSLPITITLFKPSSTLATNNANVTHTATTLATGAGGTNEKQRLTQTGSSANSFRLQFGGETSALIPYGSTAAVIEDTLVKVSTLGMTGQNGLRPAGVVTDDNDTPLSRLHTANVTCTGGPLGTAPVDLLFVSGGLQSTNVAQIVALEAATEVQTVESVVGVPGVSAVQSIALTGNPWGGTFPLTYAGQTTSGLAPTVTAAAMQSALEALSNLVPTDVAVTGSGPWVVTFNPLLGDVAPLTSTGTALKNGRIVVSTLTEGGASVVQTLVKQSRGPWHANDPYNWTAGRVPESTDFLRFQFGATGPRWGINWRETFTVDATDATLLHCAGDFVEGQRVDVKSSDTLPTGLTAGTAYYVRDVNAGAGTFRLSASRGGSPISLSGGSGTHTVYVKLTGLKTLATWTGWLGNTVNDQAGKFRDYRPIYLRSGWITAAPVTIGEGEGSASGLVRIDSGDFPIVLETLNASGSPESQLPAILWLGNHVDNTIEQIGGDLGVALLRDEVAGLLTLKVRSGTVNLGAGVTFASGGSIDVTGGKLQCQATLDGVVFIRG